MIGSKGNDKEQNKNATKNKHEKTSKQCKKTPKTQKIIMGPQ
jgi:hypothetical protein